ncbi:hypothetical protein AB1Y20_019698 [Prymnesium parvum]|uniref:Protein kinase domain-containing protein n=1 Tax=Prymnesium parvum TaxID=97485 RepID=A0AB34JUV0_PRYPA
MPRAQWPAPPQGGSGSLRLLSSRELLWNDVPWRLAELLGSGRFASVYRLRRMASLPADARSGCPEEVAAKVTELADISPWARAQLAEEAEIWSSLSHPNVLKFYGTAANSAVHISLLEFARGGELFDRIVKMASFSEMGAAEQVCQLVSAVEHIHSRGVVHRDLKPENLLLESHAPDAALKVGDFGASKRVALTAAKTPCGSLGYAAPEQMANASTSDSPSTYTAEVDIWSVGVITYILLSGAMPFDPNTYTPDRLSVSFPDSLFAEVSADAKGFIRSLLQVDPTNRLSASAALAHPWLRALSDEHTRPRHLASAFNLLSRAITHGTTPLLLLLLPTHPHTCPSHSKYGGSTSSLHTPRRLKELKESGRMKQQWDYAAEVRSTARSRAVGKRRWAEEEDGDSAEVPELMLPPEVCKRLRSNERAS